MTRRKQHYKPKSRFRNLSKIISGKFLLKRRSRLPLFLILTIFVMVQVYIRIIQPLNRVNNIESKFIKILQKTQQLRYKSQQLSHKFAFREHITAIALRNHQDDDGINWPDEVMVDYSRQETMVPIVVTVDCINVDAFSLFLSSLRESLKQPFQVVCIFAIQCAQTSKGHETEVITMINDLENVCLKEVWSLKIPEEDVRYRKRHRDIEKLQRPKLTWWYFMSLFYQQAIVDGVIFGGVLKDYEKDVLFITSDVIVAPDFLQVASVASHVKARLPRIGQFSLGVFSGSNLINAHPDSFAMVKARALPTLVYGMNLTNWKTLYGIQDDFLEDLNPCWGEAVGDAIHKTYPRLTTIVPTLSRFWLVQQPSSSTITRPSFPPWLFSPRLISVENATINTGIRDSLGFLCDQSNILNDGLLKNAICHCSVWIWDKTTNRNYPRCFPQENDRCIDSY